MGPKSTNKGPCESTMEARHKKEGHVKTEAGPGGMWPQAKGHLEPREAGRGRKGPILEHSGGLTQLVSGFISKRSVPRLAADVV